MPTSVDFVRCDPNQMVASYTSSNTYIFDIETGKQVMMLETKLNSGMCHCVLSIGPILDDRLKEKMLKP